MSNLNTILEVLTRPYMATSWAEQIQINEGLMESITAMLAEMETQSEVIALLSKKLDRLMTVSENLLLAIGKH